MLYDLNIAWSPTTSPAELERTLRFSAHLGYNVVALNHSLEAPLSANLTNPLPRYPPPPPTTATTTSPASSSPNNLPTVLHRATITFSDPSANPQLAKAAGAYDLVALRPTTEKAFQASCLSISDCALISLDLTARLPFYLRPKPCMAAVSRGLRFEIAYSRALSPSGDARARACFAGNVAQLVRATRGRGLVLSSEAASAAGLRGPADVVNLLAVWGGLPSDRGTEALGQNPRGVVANEALKRRGFRGVIDIVNVAERPGGGEGDKAGRKEEATAAAAVKNGNGKKRKNGEGNGGRGTTEGRTDGGDQPMSKRQAKKLKAALRKKESEE
ncbi:RNA-binding RNA processing protein rpp1 [Parahypoxylon ruwenzoriense]